MPKQFLTLKTEVIHEEEQDRIYGISTKEELADKRGEEAGFHLWIRNNKKVE